MFLLILSSLRVPVSEYKVQFVVVATLVRPEHDRVWCLVVELSEVRLRVSPLGQQFEIRAAAVLSFLKEKCLSLEL